MSGHGLHGSYCDCIYPCLSDSECEDNQVCMCPFGAPGRYAAMCTDADCKVNDDCDSGECGAVYYFNGCGMTASLQCRTQKDTCRTSSDCSDAAACAPFEFGATSTPFQCTGEWCIPGRPLSVAEGARVATVMRRQWGTARIEGLAPERTRAVEWLSIARMEHASVASFARFAQELLRFGAPPDLLSDALIAAADEVRHAEQTFALASAYADEPLGPGALRVDDLSPAATLDTFVARLIIEGCVGETLGVAEALAQLEQELEPQLRTCLEQIAADETRHAALAWRTLRWVSERVDRTLIEHVFAQALAQAAAPDHIHAQALASVIEPCRRQLLTEPPCASMAAATFSRD
jgi:hypothetical protein